MRKIILGLFVLGLSAGATAQDAAEKKVQAGLVLAFGPTFQKMGTKIMASDGAGSEFTIGANLNFAFNENVGLTTGLEFDFSNLKYKTSQSESIYYWYNDNEIFQRDDAASATNKDLFLLSSREQKPLYLTIPTMLIFRTNFIGYFRYFGKFGLRNSFLLKQTINDTGFNHEFDFPGDPLISSSTVNENMDAKGDMFFFRSAFGAVGGAEWNFSGSTALSLEIGYYYGFTPLHLDKNEGKTTLYTAGTINGTPDDIHFSNSATQHQLQFKLSILF
ncbi:MAG: hypothetical protein ACI865_002258 [Flavobacteriaceae bacterium]|jgi:hypothetical protein